MTDLVPLPSPAAGAVERRHPGRLPLLMAELRSELREVLADMNASEPLPTPDRRVATGGPPGLYWEPDVTICPGFQAKPVRVIVLDEDAPRRDLVALQGVDCAFPTDITTLTARDARALANALLAAANAAERRGGRRDG